MKEIVCVFIRVSVVPSEEPGEGRGVKKSGGTGLDFGLDEALQFFSQPTTEF